MEEALEKTKFLNSGDVVSADPNNLTNELENLGTQVHNI